MNEMMAILSPLTSSPVPGFALGKRGERKMKKERYERAGEKRR